MPTPIRILLVDDDPLVRTGLRFLFDSVPDELTVVGEAGDGEESLRLARQQSPDVVLMDLRMPGMDGITATRHLRSLPNPPHVIALTTWDVDDAVVRALQAGANGFLLKTSHPQDIKNAVFAVMAGDAVLSPRSPRQMLDFINRDDQMDARRSAEQAITALTDRERDVARAAGLGRSNAQIAEELYISEATVKAHLSAIQTKLNVRNRVEIAVLAERAGLLYG